MRKQRQAERNGFHTIKVVHLDDGMAIEIMSLIGKMTDMK